MLIVALTGGIATGKSVVANVLKDRGCYLHSADKVAHELMEPGQPAWKKIVTHFGQKVLNPDKTINRARLGALVFSNAKERNYLNSLIHPLVLEKKKETIDRLTSEGLYKIFISEAALTIEAGYAEFFDKVIVVFCQPKIQVKRLMARDNISKREALKKIKAQMASHEKLKHADYLIDSSGTVEQTIAQAEQVYLNLQRDYELKSKGKLNKS